MAAAVRTDQFTEKYGQGLRRRRPLARAAGAHRRPVPLDRRFDLRPSPPVLRDAHLDPGRARGHCRGARARPAGRQRHHRPHLARRRDSAGRSGRAVPDRQRRRAEGLQLVRQPPREPRGDDARHVRQHPAAQPARTGHRGGLDAAPARRGADGDLRRGDALQGGRAPRSSCWPGRSTAPALPATGPPRGPCCSGCAPSLRRASSASTAAT